MKAIYITGILLLTLGCICSSASAQSNIRDIAATNLPSIVVIEAGDSQGSGVILESSGVIATNFHVVEGADSIVVRLNNGDTYKDVSVIDFDLERDITIIKIKAFDLPAVTLGNSNEVRVGDDVVIMGAPQGLDQTVSRGIVSAIRDTGEGYSLIQTDAAISSGSSGGGMFDMSGALVGISVSYIENAQNLNFVIPINYFRGMMSTEPKYSLSEFRGLQGVGAGELANTRSASAEKSLEALMTEMKAQYEIEFINDGDTWYYIEDEAVFLVNNDNGVLITQVYSRLDADLTSEVLVRLMKSNYLSNYAKIGIDPDGDLIVLNEADLHSTTSEQYAVVLTSLLTLNDILISIVGETPTVSGDPMPSKNPLLTSGKISGFPRRDFLENSFSINIDPSQWTLDTSELPTDSEFQFNGDSVWFTVIAEEAELSYEYMEAQILRNMQEVDANAVISETGFREVNGKRMLWARAEAEAEGINFTFYYHIYTGAEGTVQLVGWATKNVFERKIPDLEEVYASFIVR